MLDGCLEILAILILIAVNGFFAMSELALLTARKAVLAGAADRGDKRAVKALALLERPDQLLSTVQIGITLVGVMAGVFGGATLAGRLEGVFAALGIPDPYAGALALVLVVAGVTYLTIILGELAPKRLAIARSERLAMWAAPAMWVFLRLTRPVVTVLGASTRLVLAALGLDKLGDRGMTEEDVRAVIDEARRTGVLEKPEKDMMKRIIRFGDRRVSALMTYRTDVDRLDLEADEADLVRVIQAGGHSHYPVTAGNPADVRGVAAVSDLFSSLFTTGRLDLAGNMREPLFVPETARALDLMDVLKKTSATLAVVVDEYGDVVGIVTVKSMVEAVFGDIRDGERKPEPLFVQNADGSLLIDAAAPMDEVCDRLGLSLREDEKSERFATLAGFMINHMDRLPEAGEGFDFRGRRFEVVEKTGGRIEKALVTPLAADAEEEGEGA